MLNRIDFPFYFLCRDECIIFLCSSLGNVCPKVKNSVRAQEEENLTTLSQNCVPSNVWPRIICIPHHFLARYSSSCWKTN